MQLKYTGMILFCLVSNFVFANAITPQSLLLKVFKNKKQFSSLRADIKVYVIDNGVQYFKGQYYANAQGMVRMDFTYPKGQSVLINAKGFYWFFKKDKQAILLPAKASKSFKQFDTKKIGNMSIEEFEKQNIVYLGKELNWGFSFYHKLMLKPAPGSIYYNKANILMKIHATNYQVAAFMVIDKDKKIIYAQEYFNYQNGIPCHIKTTVRKKNKAQLINNSYYSNIKLNLKLPKELFMFNQTDYKIIKLEKK